MYPQHLHDKPRTPHLSLNTLQTQNRQFSGTGGVSAENRAQRFRPAFMDRRTGEVYPSRFGDGRPAPIHLLDGLPAPYRFGPRHGRARLAHGRIYAGGPLLHPGASGCYRARCELKNPRSTLAH
jgi:hypothetical protein